jgi:P-type Cu2+ transporter
VKKKEGDEVIAATINGEGSLRVEITGTGDKTKLSGIMRLVADAQKSKSRAQHLADRAAQILTGVAILSGILTLIVWQLLGASIDFSIVRVVTVLVIACPHALGLAVPLVVAISTTLGAKNGLLVRDRRGLEEARNLNTVIFDKTGTLTLGEFRVVEMAVADGSSDEEALRIAAGVESESEHPIARGIVKTAEDRKLDVPAAEGFRALTGKGVAASVDGAEYHIGGPALLKEEDAQIPDALRTAAEAAAARGQAAIYLLRDGKAMAVFAVADAIREESREAIRALHERGIEVAMLTGDAQAVADAVATELGIDTVFAQVLPGGQGLEGAGAASTGEKGGDGGRWGERCPRLGHRRYRDCDRRGHGCRGGSRTHRARAIRPARHPQDRGAVPRHLPEDAPEPVVGCRLQHRRDTAGRRSARGVGCSPYPGRVGAVLMSASTVVVAINAQLLKRVEL